MTWFWLPRIAPALTKGNRLRYAIRTKTPGTEKAAFTEEGAPLGMAALLPVGELFLHAIAPEGHRFEIVETYICDYNGANLPMEDRHGKPELESEGREIKWRVEDPEIAVRFKLRIRIHKTA